ncbi:glycoside hydrolase family 3 protein [Acuticoccus sediminis]|uniref:glycoside hydrolase family 3 protein n=1 Tax=Acuticoccus sediminis TaxID=2184697 RepID=UPI001CFE495D|nr:glycoside hydrolase family 3 N-terminal domain-containing protein [Acuticoccus sediminis]
MSRRILQVGCAAIVLAAAVAAIAPTAAQKHVPLPPEQPASRGGEFLAAEAPAAGIAMRPRIGAGPGAPEIIASPRPAATTAAATARPPLTPLPLKIAPGADPTPGAATPSADDEDLPLLGEGERAAGDDALVTVVPRAKPERPGRRRFPSYVAGEGDPPLEVMVGQMLMVGFQGDDVDQPGPQRIARHIEAGRLGGVIFFRQNVKSEAAVKRLTHLFRASAPPGLPVLIAVDQEGGHVQRLNTEVGFPDTPSAKRVAARGEAAAKRIYTRLARDLAEWGFNVNLAPVVDLGNQRDNPIIAKLGRAFSGDPATIAAYASLFVEAHRDAGVLTALKHFPGHGSSRGDTHKGFVDVSYSWTETELTPYRDLVAENMVDMVMVAHVHLAKYGPGGLPASLSEPMIEGLLRGNIGFNGVVMSDDLEMGAIRKLGSPIRIAKQAILAGNDILVYAGGAAGRGDLVGELQARLQVAARDPVFAARIKDSYHRVMTLKAKLPGE